MSLEELANKYSNHRGSYKKHQRMQNDLVDYLYENTDVLGVFTNFELLETNKWGGLYAKGEIDVFAIYMDRIEIYNVKSRATHNHHNKTRKQRRGELNYTLKHIVGAPMKYYSFMPGFFREVTQPIKIET